MSTLHCDYCGLPLPGGARAAVAKNGDRKQPLPVDDREVAAPIGPYFCCIGCRFAASIAGEAGTDGQASTMLARLGLSIFFTMNVMVFTMALWSKDVYGLVEESPTYAAFLDLFRYGSLLFSAPVALMLGVPLFHEVREQLGRRVVTTDLLLISGVLSAFIYSSVAVVTGQDHVYFEVACVILVAVTLGRWLEATGKWKTTQALRALTHLLPKSTRRALGEPVAVPPTDCALSQDLRQEQTLAWEEVDVQSLRTGDLIRILPGERLPTDGRIEQGRATIDEQILSGESSPRTCDVGDTVYGGSLNTDGDLVLRVSAGVREGTLQRLIDAVHRALAAKGPEERLADRIAAWFLPLVFVTAVGTFGCHAASRGVGAGLMAGLAVVLIACPCALGVATPLAIWSAMGNGVRRQVLFRDGDALSRLAKVKVVAFDKTGTLTTGHCDVDALIVSDNAKEPQVRQTAGAVASCSAHGLSKAIARFASAPSAGARRVRSIPGRGLAAYAKGIDGDVLLGSRELMDDFHLRWPSRLRDAANGRLAAGFPIACVGWGSQVRGLFVLREELREELRPAIDALRRLGMRLEILSGDHSLRARSLGASLGIAAQSGMLPLDKLAAIEVLRQQTGSVAMVGDGVNDAPALAAADVGIALACGADISRDAGDICLLSNDLERIPWAIELARRTVQTIKQNLFWAFAYNVVGVGLAAAGWLNPIFAAAAMVVSSLFVVTNSLKLAHFGK